MRDKVILIQICEFNLFYLLKSKGISCHVVATICMCVAYIRNTSSCNRLVL